MRPAEAVMDLGRDVARLLGFLLQGSSTNWWGLGCPAHCSGSLLRLCLWSLDLASARASFLDFSFSGRSSSCPVLELPLFRSPRHHFPRPRGHLHFGSEATCMSRGNLLRTIRSAVDSLRGVLAELEEDSEEWPPASEQLSLPGLGPSRSTDIPVSPPVAACPSTTSALPRPGDPLPSDGLFLVASLHVLRGLLGPSGLGNPACRLAVCSEESRVIPTLAVRSRVYLVLRCWGDLTPRYFTSFGRFKLHTGALERGDCVCHRFPTRVPIVCKGCRR